MQQSGNKETNKYQRVHNIRRKGITKVPESRVQRHPLYDHHVEREKGEPCPSQTKKITSTEDPFSMPFQIMLIGAIPLLPSSDTVTGTSSTTPCPTLAKQKVNELKLNDGLDMPKANCNFT